jgi:hypothetical protein
VERVHKQLVSLSIQLKKVKEFAKANPLYAKNVKAFINHIPFKA